MLIDDTTIYFSTYGIQRLNDDTPLYSSTVFYYNSIAFEYGLELEETIKRLQEHSGVQGIVVIDKAGRIKRPN